jgi:hypothetical protein
MIPALVNFWSHLFKKKQAAEQHTRPAVKKYNYLLLNRKTRCHAAKRVFALVECKAFLRFFLPEQLPRDNLKKYWQISKYY